MCDLNRVLHGGMGVSFGFRNRRSGSYHEVSSANRSVCACRSGRQSCLNGAALWKSK